MERFYRFLGETTADSLDLAIVEQAKRVVLDTLGVILAASQEPEPENLAMRLIAMNSGGTATVWRAGLPKVPPPQAAFLNGATGPFLELDEGHRYYSTHAAIHVLPACLALAEHQRNSGMDLIVALVVGYDAAARIGGACKKNPKLHPHGTWPTVGAAVACGKLRGFSMQGMRRAVNLAAGLTLATSSRTTLEGATVRNAAPGIAAQTGLLATLMAESHYCGLEDGLQEVFGRISANEFSVEKLQAEIGERFEITRNFFKQHACCQFNHAALDALEELLVRHKLSGNDINRIDVETFFPATRMSDPAPQNMLAAKFSLPYAIAARLVLGDTGVASFRPAPEQADTIRSVAEKVVVHEDLALSRAYPFERSARLTIRLNSGEVLRTFRQAASGYDTPMPTSLLEQKFIDLASPVIGQEQAQLTVQWIGELEKINDVSTLSENLLHASGRGVPEDG